MAQKNDAKEYRYEGLPKEYRYEGLPALIVRETEVGGIVYADVRAAELGIVAVITEEKQKLEETEWDSGDLDLINTLPEPLATAFREKKLSELERTKLVGEALAPSENTEQEVEQLRDLEAYLREQKGQN